MLCSDSQRRLLCWCSARACFGLTEDLTLRLWSGAATSGPCVTSALHESSNGAVNGAQSTRFCRDVWQLAACKTLASKRQLRNPVAQTSDGSERSLVHYQSSPALAAPLACSAERVCLWRSHRLPFTREDQLRAKGPADAPRHRREAAPSREQSAEAAYEQQHEVPSVVAGAGRIRRESRRRRHRRHD